jgi:hypothetical protein
MWHHLANLLGRSWENLVRATSTNTLGFIVWTVAITVMSWAATLAGTWFQLKREDVQHPFARAFRNSLWPGLFEAAGIVVLVLCGWSIFAAKTVYEDHQSHVLENTRLVSENQTLRRQLKDAEDNAEQRCGQAKDKEIVQLKKERNAVCYRPDRRLLPEDREHLFLRLGKLARDLVKAGKTPTIRIYAINCDKESTSFAEQLRQVFQNAGRILKYPISDGDRKEADEQYDWVNKSGSVTGVVIFDKGAPTGYSAMLIRGMLAEVDVADGSPMWGSGLKDMPHLQEPIVWVGYKPTYP